MGLFKTEQEKLQSRLRKANYARHLDKMRQALAGGADANDPGAGGACPLYYAADHNYVDCVRLLLENKADPDRLHGTWSPLMTAANDGSAEVVTLLLAAGAKTDFADTHGETALHKAARRGHGGIIRLLLANGADPAAADHRMNTPADAAEKEYPRLADLIRGKAPAPETAPQAAPETVPGRQSQGWHLTAPDEVSNFAEKPAIGYSVTEIFNFGSGIYTRLAQNLKTGGESQSLRFFDEFTDQAPLERARAALVALGGKAAADAGARTLDKPALPAPGGPK